MSPAVELAHIGIATIAATVAGLAIGLIGALLLTAAGDESAEIQHDEDHAGTPATA